MYLILSSTTKLPLALVTELPESFDYEPIVFKVVDNKFVRLIAIPAEWVILGNGDTVLSRFTDRNEALNAFHLFAGSLGQCSTLLRTHSAVQGTKDGETFTYRVCPYRWKVQ